MRRTGLLLTLALAMLLTASAADAAGRVLYRATASDNHVLAYGLAPTGALFPIAGSPVARSGSPQGVALTPDGRFLYVALGTSGQIAGFSVNAEGALSALPGSPFPTGASLLGLAVSPDGHSLYEVSYAGNAVYRQAINVDGSLSAPGAPTSTGASSSPEMAAITPDGRFLYVSTSGLGSVAGYAVAADGSLSPLPGSPFPSPSGGIGISIAPDGANLYLATTLKGVYAASIGADGLLTALAGSPFPSGSGTRGIAITADGRRLYTSNTAGGSGQGTWGYNVTADGSLAAGTPFAPAGQSAIAMAPDSHHLYVGNAFGGTTNGLTIGGAGELTPAPGSPYPNAATSSDAWQMTVSPDQPPVAAFAASPGVVGTPSVFDASASADPDGSIALYDWSFGDGSTASAGAVTTHRYSSPGTYRVTVTETDDEGCSTAFVFTGQTAMCNGSPVAQASHEIVVAPEPNPPASTPTTPPAVAPDKKPPVLKLSGKKKQTFGATVSVGAACDERCTVTASGRVRTGQGKARRSFKLQPKSVHLAPRAAGTLKLVLTNAVRKAATEALEGGSSASAALSITATDGSGNATTAKRQIQLALPR